MSLPTPNAIPPTVSIEIAVGSPASALTINCGAAAINFSIVVLLFCLKLFGLVYGQLQKMPNSPAIIFPHTTYYG